MEVPNATSPLDGAKKHERRAEQSTLVVISVVLILIAGGVGATGEMSGSDHERMMNGVMTIAQLIVTLTTLALVRNQVSVAVRQIEQAEAGDVRLTQLIDSIQTLARNTVRRSSIGASNLPGAALDATPEKTPQS